MPKAKRPAAKTKRRFKRLPSLISLPVIWAVVPLIAAGVLGLSFASSQPVLQPIVTHHAKTKVKVAKHKKTVKPRPKPATTKPVPASSAAAATTAASTPKPAPVVVPSPQSKVHGLKPKTTSPSSSSPGSSSPASATTYSSTNWSGYLAANGSYTQVSGSWTAPSPTGNGSSTSADATWIGIGGVTSGDLIQVGTSNTVTRSGHVYTSAFYELLPDASQTITSLTVNAGDAISASVAQTSPGQWTISITDQTTGQSYTHNTAYASSNSSAEWIEEDPSYASGSLVPFDNFGSVSFYSGLTTVGGGSVNIAGANASAVILVSQFSGQAIATPGGLSGGSFSVTHN